MIDPARFCAMRNDALRHAGISYSKNNEMGGAHGVRAHTLMILMSDESSRSLGEVNRLESNIMMMAPAGGGASEKRMGAAVRLYGGRSTARTWAKCSVQ